MTDLTQKILSILKGETTQDVRKALDEACNELGLKPTHIHIGKLIEKLEVVVPQPALDQKELDISSIGILREELTKSILIVLENFQRSFHKAHPMDSVLQRTPHQ